MRKVVKDFDKKPLSLTKQETLDHLKIIIENKDAKKINSDFYRGKYEKEDGTKGDEVIEGLNILYRLYWPGNKLFANTLPNNCK